MVSACPQPRKKARRSRSLSQTKAITTADAAVLDRLNKLAQAEMEFIFNDDFPQAKPESILNDPLLDAGSSNSSWKPSKHMPTHLVRMCERKLFTPAEERAYFRRMNYAKYRADLLRRKLGREPLDQALMQEIEALRDQGLADREEIVRANLRLVVSIAKKFSGGVVSFDDLLSEGIETLLRAVEKFDCTRGFRFSTYATQAVRRTLYRHVQAVQKDRTRFTLADQNVFADCPAAEGSSPADERRFALLRSRLADFLDQLDSRERMIIQLRFGLEESDQVRTLQSLATEMGICKERVRQLEIRAIAKLRTMAEQVETQPAPCL